MRVIFGRDSATGLLPCLRAVTVGMFDGVHVGHQKTISRTVERASDLGGEAAIVTFDRHPESVVVGKSPLLITSLRHRISLFEGLGTNLCLVLHFDKRLAAMSARDFLGSVLIGRLGAKVVILGENSRFGARGEGDFEFLTRVAPEYGISAECVPLVRLGDRVVSSTALREAIGAGDLEAAEAMLGRRVSLLGTVVHGDAMGGRIGFPTANLDLHHEVRPPRGVYAASVPVGGTDYPAVMNIGVRPTVGKGLLERVEVHLIGFTGSLRGRDLEVRMVKRLRPETRFGSMEELATQIRKDCAAAVDAVCPRKTPSVPTRRDT